MDRRAFLATIASGIISPVEKHVVQRAPASDDEVLRPGYRHVRLASADAADGLVLRPTPDDHGTGGLMLWFRRYDGERPPEIGPPLVIPAVDMAGGLHLRGTVPYRMRMDPTHGLSTRVTFRERGSVTVYRELGDETESTLASHRPPGVVIVVKRLDSGTPPTSIPF